MIVGLGNPGRQYEGTRHNLGFMVVEAFAKRHDMGLREQAKFLGRTARGRVGMEEVLCLLPSTYMNESGRAVAKMASYYKLEADRVLVVCDDVELDFGTIRVRMSGGSGGHRGLNSVAQSLGTQGYPRMRLGVGREDGTRDLADYVLARFAPVEEEKLGDWIEQAVDQLDRMLATEERDE